jgi:hypothetical protein
MTMAINRKPIFIGVPFSLAANTTVGAILDDDDSTNAVTVIEGASDGSVVQSLNCVNDTADVRAVNVIFNNGTTDIILGQVAITANAGSSATPAIELLNTTDIPSLAKRDDGSILLFDGQSLKVAVTAALESDQLLHIVPLGGNLTA